MARFEARLLREEIKREMKRLRARNTMLLKLMVGDDEFSTAAKALLDGGWVVAGRAKEIISEKGHIDSGNLRRSISAQLVPSPRLTITVEVGTFVFYAPFVEALPDGGYLFPASEESFPVVRQIMEERGVNAVLVRWAA